MSVSPSRRDWLRRALATGIGSAAAMLNPGFSSAASRTKVRLGFIGVGQRGLGHVQRTIRRPDDTDLGDPDEALAS